MYLCNKPPSGYLINSFPPTFVFKFPSVQNSRDYFIYNFFNLKMKSIINSEVVTAFVQT